MAITMSGCTTTTIPIRDDSPAPPATTDNDTATVTKPNGGHDHYCHACRTPHAVFSKSQKKKKAADRKCRSCVAKLLSWSSMTEASPSLPKREGDPRNKKDGAAFDEADREDRGDGLSPGDVVAATVAAVAAAVAAPSAATEPVKSGEDDSSDSDDLEHEFDVLDESGNWSPLVRDEEEKEDSCAGGNRTRRRADAESDADDDSHSESDSRSNHEVSVEDLKRQILGRAIPSHDADDEARAFSAGPSSPVARDDAATAAHLRRDLRHDLTCPVCHDRFYEPVSLPCGHSFCRACWTWWTRRRRQEEDAVDAEEDVPIEDATCPVCRAPVGAPFLGVNTALKACLNVLYGAEMHQRRLAEERRKRRATAGERGGAHCRGNVVLVPLPETDDEEESGWISIEASTSTPTSNGFRAPPISIRRNVVLDDTDQCRQLSLAFTRCSVLPSSSARLRERLGASPDLPPPLVVDVELCLLSMEEDEIDDSGFPTVVSNNSIDEALICTGSDRVHSCIEATAVICSANGNATAAIAKTEVALSRGMIGRDGSVRFRFDLHQILHQARMDDARRNHRDDDDDDNDEEKRTGRIEMLRFRHVDTGAVLEMRPPSRRDVDSRRTRDLETEEEEEEEYEEERRREECYYNNKRKSRNDPSRFILNNEEDDEQDEYDHPVNAYQEDDFLVGDDHESEEEMDADDEHDECHICHQGGDLIVCDGGDHEGGCGRAYHVECIHRTEVPPGDWICNHCAANIGMDHVGIEGYEWKDNESGETTTDRVDEEQSTGSNHASQPTIHKDDNEEDDNEDDDSEDEIRVPSRKRPKMNVLDVDDSDDDGNVP